MPIGFPMKHMRGGFPSFNYLDDEDNKPIKRSFQKGIDIQKTGSGTPDQLYKLSYSLQYDEMAYFAQFYKQYRVTKVDIFVIPRCTGDTFEQIYVNQDWGPTVMFECDWNGAQELNNVEDIINQPTYSEHYTMKGGWFHKCIDNPTAYMYNNQPDLLARKTKLQHGTWLNTTSSFGLQVEYYGAAIGFKAVANDNMPNMGVKGHAIVHCEFRGKQWNKMGSYGGETNLGPDGMTFWSNGGNNINPPDSNLLVYNTLNTY